MPAPSPAELLECLRRDGAHSLSYATLQPGLKYLHRPGLGYLAYQPLGKHGAAVLGDPVAAPEAWPQLIALAQEKLPRACFVQVTQPWARLLAEQSYSVNRMGEEIVLPLARWNLRGRRKQNLRTVLNRARRQGVVAEELTEWTDTVKAELREVSRSWLMRHAPGGSELRFLLRPAAVQPEEGVRIWLARNSSGKLLAFACFDPLHQAGVVTGYAANILRAAAPSAELWRAMLVCAAAERFHSEDILELNLGIAPFISVDTPPELNPSWFTHLCFWANPRFYNWLYNFRGIAQHKAQYGGESRPVYFAARSRYPLGQLLGVLAASGVNPWRRLAWRQPT